MKKLTAFIFALICVLGFAGCVNSNTCNIEFTVPAEFDAVGGEWFKIGLHVRNETDVDKTVYVTVSGVEVRIE